MKGPKMIAVGLGLVVAGLLWLWFLSVQARH